jgi:hypothetical protein
MLTARHNQSSCGMWDRQCLIIHTNGLTGCVQTSANLPRSCDCLSITHRPQRGKTAVAADIAHFLSNRISRPPSRCVDFVAVSIDLIDAKLALHRRAFTLVESIAELCQRSSRRECASFWYDSNVVMSGRLPPSGTAPSACSSPSSASAYRSLASWSPASRTRLRKCHRLPAFSSVMSASVCNSDNSFGM